MAIIRLRRLMLTVVAAAALAGSVMSTPPLQAVSATAGPTSKMPAASAAPRTAAQASASTGRQAAQESVVSKKSATPARQTLSVGGSHACALDTEGRAWCWGSDWDGQLGNGFRDNQLNDKCGISEYGRKNAQCEFSPVEVAGGRRYTAISAGWDHTCALDARGRAWCWGQDAHGQLGSRKTRNRMKARCANNRCVEWAPTAVAGRHRFRVISAAWGTTCAIDTRSKAWCWGYDTSGQVGNGQGDQETNCWWDFHCEPRPVVVAGQRHFTDVSVGPTHSCALDKRGSAWCWGEDDFGELGDGRRPRRKQGTCDEQKTCEFKAVAVRGGVRFDTITVGTGHTCGLDGQGRAWCWGEGDEGQLGSGEFLQGQRKCQHDGNGYMPNVACEYQPVRVLGGHVFVGIDGRNGEHTCAIDTQDRAWCWGQDTDGELGDTIAGHPDGYCLGTSGRFHCEYQPVPVVGGHSYTTIAVGRDGGGYGGVSCGLNADGRAYCWGSGQFGQTGDGSYTTETRYQPTPVADDHTFKLPR